MNETERTIRLYLNRSAGICNHVSLHTLQCFVGMVQTGEADVETFRRIGGDWLVSEMRSEAMKNDWGPLELSTWDWENHKVSD